MKNYQTYSFNNLRAYLKKFRYVRTYRQGRKDAYHHYKTNEHVLVPYGEGSYTEEELLELFKNSKGTELPAEIEICRLKLFIHQELKK